MAQDTLVEKISLLKPTMNLSSENFNQLVMIEKDLYEFSMYERILHHMCNLKLICACSSLLLR